MRLLIKGCLLEGERRVNILVENGLISKISEGEIKAEAEVIEADGYGQYRAWWIYMFIPGSLDRNTRRILKARVLPP